MASISLRCTDKEKEKIKQVAEMKGLDLSKYILRVCKDSITTRTEKPIPPDIICNLSSLINKLEAKELKKRDFIEQARKELDKWQR
ncbi:hypothetical protein DS742_27355 [Lacrimispora amygdalina]|uniref:Uncharacterized protein n=1 Tax=Lacrimispora amygdalina TaxID=253257 RepID=A0A3E2N427_9FIRM|nr:DUF6290 family protein [Clostridium indicum]RFZ75728.1 hypothetical protein DS742_27355 [Clostridium indicum]